MEGADGEGAKKEVKEEKAGIKSILHLVSGKR